MANVVDGIITPEGIVLDIETAGFASRILAGLFDLMIQLFLTFVLGVVLTFGLGGSDSAALTAFAIASFVAIFGYPIVFETWRRGRTPGKSALGIRAVTIEGAPIGLREATLRAMGGVVDRLLPPGGITGALFVLFTPRHQRIGDLISGTMVIRDPERFSMSPAWWFSAPTGLEAYADTIDPTAITVEQYTVIRSFLTRGARLSPAVRASLGRDLADRLGEQIRHERPPFVMPEVFLMCAMARYQRRNGPGQSTYVAWRT